MCVHKTKFFWGGIGLDKLKRDTKNGGEGALHHHAYFLGKAIIAQ